MEEGAPTYKSRPLPEAQGNNQGRQNNFDSQSQSPVNRRWPSGGTRNAVSRVGYISDPGDTTAAAEQINVNKEFSDDGRDSPGGLGGSGGPPRGPPTQAAASSKNVLGIGEGVKNRRELSRQRIQQPYLAVPTAR